MKVWAAGREFRVGPVVEGMAMAELTLIDGTVLTGIVMKADLDEMDDRSVRVALGVQALGTVAAIVETAKRV